MSRIRPQIKIGRELREKLGSLKKCNDFRTKIRYLWKNKSFHETVKVPLIYDFPTTKIKYLYVTDKWLAGYNKKYFLKWSVNYTPETLLKLYDELKYKQKLENLIND